jgi:hypothetical protein
MELEIEGVGFRVLEIRDYGCSSLIGDSPSVEPYSSPI